MVNGQVLEDGCCNYTIEQRKQTYDVEYIPGELRVLSEIYAALDTDTITYLVSTIIDGTIKNPM